MNNGPSAVSKMLILVCNLIIKMVIPLFKQLGLIANSVEFHILIAFLKSVSGSFLISVTFMTIVKQ